MRVRADRRLGVLLLLLLVALAFLALPLIRLIDDTVVGSEAQAECRYEAATRAVNATIDGGGAVSVIMAEPLDGTPSGGAPILFDADRATGAAPGPAPIQCGEATTANTSEIVVLGTPGSGESLLIDDRAGTGSEAGIEWLIDLGSSGVDGEDTVEILGADDVDDIATLTDDSFAFNGWFGSILGVEERIVRGGGGDDMIDGSGMTETSGVFRGGSGDDWIAPGASGVAPTTAERVFGGADVDTLSYGTRAMAVVIDNVRGSAGFDANGDGVLGAGDELDSHAGFEVFETHSGPDTIVGAPDVVERFLPGDGDDDITGQAGQDALDWSTSSVGMTIDLMDGTASGDGVDAFRGFDAFVGSPFDDTLLVETDAPGPSVASFSGGDGTDAVHASAADAGVVLDLPVLSPAADVEGAMGGRGDDSIIGNDAANRLVGDAGDDVILGAGGSDTLIGGPGDDVLEGGEGADTVSFQTNTMAGVRVDAEAGIARSRESGRDEFRDVIELVSGSPFDDVITGGRGDATRNFVFLGGRGDDVLTGAASNDILQGGPGDDILRGLGGGDTLDGGPGEHDRAVGGPSDDFCRAAERRVGCE